MILNNRGYQSLAVDLPGHGSLATEGSFSFEGANSILQENIDQYFNERAENAGDSITNPLIKGQVILVGISLGGQVVLSYLQNLSHQVNRNIVVMGALVSGVFIHPPNEAADFEIPHLPANQKIMDMLMEDVQIVGMEKMPAIQEKSFAFTFGPHVVEKADQKYDQNLFPPVLVMVGENDIVMAKRDFEELVLLVKKCNDQSESKIMKGAWHNHNLDVPELFADAISRWISVLEGVQKM